jgi:hypothetical protein
VKSLLVLMAIASLGLGASACGSASKYTGSLPQTYSNAAPTGAESPTAALSARSSALRYLKGDEDDDESPGSHAVNSKNDNDVDSDNDYLGANTGYYDSDDVSIRAYGHVAGATDRRMISALIEHYYAAAATNESMKACSLIDASLAKAILEGYGQAPGSAHLHGAKTCPAVISLLFERYRSHLTPAIEVIGVRVNGQQASALLGSRTIPASVITMKREEGAWKIDSLFGGSLP